MKFNQIIRWITWGFNLLFYTVLLNFGLLFFYAATHIFLTSWGSFAVIVIVDLCFCYFFGKNLYRKIVSQKNPENQQTVYVGRFCTARKFLLFALLVDIVLFCILWAFGCGFLHFKYAWLVFLILPIGAIAWGIYKPEARDSQKFQIWLTFGIIVEVILFLFLFFCFAITPRQINYSSNYYAPSNYTLLPQPFIKQMLPEKSSDIEISGQTGLGFSLGANINWRCRVSESDFLTFAKNNKYMLKENDPYYNANPETNHERIDSSSLFQFKKLPESFYYYNYRYRNNGGWTLLYNRINQTLYGQFSSN